MGAVKNLNVALGIWLYYSQYFAVLSKPKIIVPRLNGLPGQKAHEKKCAKGELLDTSIVSII